MRSLNRQGAPPARKSSVPPSPTVVAAAAPPTVASTHATVAGWRERRATLEQERAEKDKAELAARAQQAQGRGEVVSECIVGETGIGRGESETVELESQRVARHFQTSLDSAVRLDAPIEKKFHFSAAFDRDWNVTSLDEVRFVRRLVDEINALRADPPAWLATLDEFRACFNGATYESPTASAVKSVTDEGVAAVQIARDVLAALSPLPLLTLAPGLSLSCASFTSTQTGELSPPTGAKARRELHGSSAAYVELLNVGGATPKEVVLQWLVADGQETRKNRKALLNPAATHIGAAAVRNKNCFQLTFAAIAEGFKPK